MSIIQILIYLVLIGFLVYLAETYIPMSPPFKTVVRGIVAILLILWLLQLFGITGPIIK